MERNCREWIIILVKIINCFLFSNEHKLTNCPDTKIRIINTFINYYLALNITDVLSSGTIAPNSIFDVFFLGINPKLLK